ncbi:class I SAM-dependent methyltransferase [Rhizobium sp. A22-96]
MPISAEKYLSEVKDTIKGWLYPGAVEVTEMLLAAQKTMNIPGDGLEIGVFEGAYLSFMAASTDIKWAGMDVFFLGQQETAKNNVERVVTDHASTSTVTLIQSNSQSLTEEAFKAHLASAGITSICFASIDGDHSADGVFHDMKLVESVLSPGGIMALDDFFSPTSAAVSEGVFRYMASEGSNLRPIAFSDNKLFVTTKDFDELYRIKCMIALNDGNGLCARRWKDGSPQMNRVRPFLGASLMAL